jgi:hypothetical protein
MSGLAEVVTEVYWKSLPDFSTRQGDKIGDRYRYKTPNIGKDGRTYAFAFDVKEGTLFKNYVLKTFILEG